MEQQLKWEDIDGAAAPEHGDDWMSLAVLLRGGMSVGQLATAIEHQGIYTWDPFDRLLHFKPGTAPAKQALDFLALEAKCRREKEPTPSDLDELDSPMSLLGWRRGDLPFDSVQVAPLRKDTSTKAENANSIVIGALLRVIDGSLTGVSHPAWSSRSALAELLQAELPRVANLSKSSLLDKFGKADKHLGAALEQHDE